MRAILPAVAALLCACAPATPPPSAEAQDLYDRALKSLTEGSLPAARAILGDLLRDHPDFYKGYAQRWQVIGRMSDQDVVTDVVRRDLEVLERIPKPLRNDDLFEALIEGSDWLGDTGSREAWRKEAIESLPAGRMARRDRLKAAGDESDPRRAAAQYQAILEEFPEDTGMGVEATLLRLELVARHPDLFDARVVLAAAERWEKAVEADGMPGRDPGEYFSALLQISDTLAERAPSKSLEYARKGMTLLERKSASEDLEEEMRFDLLPVLVRAYRASGDWQSALRVSESLLEAIESGATSSEVLRRIDEARVRLLYGRALEATGAVEAARLQVGLASALDHRLQPESAALGRRHPPDPSRIREDESRLALETRRMLERRRDHARQEVQSNERRLPALDFTLKSLAGDTMSLSDFRGRTVVLNFWATWCGPCLREMQELGRIHRDYRDDSRVAFVGVSLDMEKARVPRFVQEHGILFPILLSDGTVDHFYTPDGIPQLYVIDPAGRIRFTQGLLDDGYDRDRLAWMIEAARR